MNRATNTDWRSASLGEWNPKAMFSGNGVVVAGTVVSHRPHSVAHTRDIDRFHAIIFDMETAHKRTYDKYGQEIEPFNAGDSVKIAGHLSVSKEKPRDVNALTADQLCEVFGNKSGTSLPDKFLEEHRSLLHPTVPNRFEVWADVECARRLDLKPGDKIRFKTVSDSIFVQSIARNDGKSFSNYSGGQVLDEASSRISKVRDAKSDGALKQDMREGVDESEWD